METKINHGASNVTKRAAVKVTRDIDGKVCKVYGREEWTTVTVIHLPDGCEIDVRLESGEQETWYASKACLVTPEYVPTSLAEVADAVDGLDGEV